MFHSKAEVEGLYQTLSEYASANGLIISKISKGTPAAITKSSLTSKKKKSKIVQFTKKELEKTLKKNKIKCSVFGREKKPYSIWKKLEIQHKSLEQLSDIFGFRVCVETIQECYEVLGILHCEWQAIPGKFKDYISTPKKNGYQSLHTTLIGSY